MTREYSGARTAIQVKMKYRIVTVEDKPFVNIRMKDGKYEYSGFTIDLLGCDTLYLYTKILWNSPW